MEIKVLWGFKNSNIVVIRSLFTYSVHSEKEFNVTGSIHLRYQLFLSIINVVSYLRQLERLNDTDDKNMFKRTQTIFNLINIFNSLKNMFTFMIIRQKQNFSNNLLLITI